MQNSTIVSGSYSLKAYLDEEDGLTRQAKSIDDYVHLRKTTPISDVLFAEVRLGIDLIVRSVSSTSTGLAIVVFDQDNVPVGTFSSTGGSNSNFNVIIPANYYARIFGTSTASSIGCVIVCEKVKIESRIIR
jgi:hypothetical protein